MLKKLNSTIVTLGVAGVLAIAIGFYVNSVSWGPQGEQKTAAATDDTTAATNTDKSSQYPTWAASATGRVEPKSGEVRITADVPGRIENIAVDLNDKVKAGDLLVRQEDDIALTKVAAATAQAAARERDRNEESVRGLASDRREAEDDVASAERARFGARQAFDDAVHDKRDGKGSDSAVATARKNLEDADKKLADQRANLASVNAKSRHAAADAARSRHSPSPAPTCRRPSSRWSTPASARPSTAPCSTSSARRARSPSRRRTNTLLVFGDLSGLKVRAEVEERDAAKIRVGQRVVVRADAYPDQDFEGRVSSIAQSLSPPRIASRGPRRPNDVEVLEALIDLDGLPPLLTGMRVDVFFKHDATASTQKPSHQRRHRSSCPPNGALAECVFVRAAQRKIRPRLCVAPHSAAMHARVTRAEPRVATREVRCSDAATRRHGRCRRQGSARSVLGQDRGSSVGPMKRPKIHHTKRPTSSITVKNDGTNTSDSTVETSRPPITAIAIGARNSPPSPNAMALGSMPATMASVVMTMGRARLRPASITASMRGMPLARSPRPRSRPA